MKTWPLPLFLEAYNAFVESGKTVEGRVPDFALPEKDYRNMKVGDLANFYVVDEENLEPLTFYPELRFKVNFIHHYETIEEMLTNEDMEELLPGVTSLEEGINIYLSLPGYKRRVDLYGVYAIGLKDKEVVQNK